MAEIITNWAANLRYGAARVHRPRSVSEIQEIVASAGRVKALGTRHSFSTIADTEGDLVSLEHLDKIVEVDRARMTVTVEGGISYGKLCRYLSDEGLAVHNLASLPHISVAGACATGTHGSGDLNGNLATAVTSMEVVTAEGAIVEFRREQAEFQGAIVHLGGLGIVTRLTLEVQPAFTVRQEVYQDLPLADLLARFDEIMSSGYSVSLFTHWQGSLIDQVWIKRVGEGGFPFVGGRRATSKLHPIKTVDPINCTEQLGIPGPSHERLPHFRMDYMPSAGQELQSEYLVPRKHAVEALLAIDAISVLISPLSQICEIRTVAEDGLWMSPQYATPTIGIHFTWKKDWNAVQGILPLVEQALLPFEARPHWGKLFLRGPGDLYPKLHEFRALLQAYDPDGKFRNRFLETILWGDS